MTEKAAETQRKFSHSSMMSWRTCKMQYYWKYVEGYVPPPSMGQIRGTLGHIALGEWYRTHDQEAALNASYVEMCNLRDEHQLPLEEAWEALELVLRRYFNWSKGIDDWEMLAVEQEFDLEIDGHRIGGYIDGILKTKDTIWLLENKFNQRASTSHVDLDPQVSLYLLAANLMGYHPYGAIYNVVRMGDDGIAQREPALRSYVYRNPEGLRVIYNEVAAQAAEMEAFHKNGGVVYRSPSKDCHWACPFYSVCLSINDNGDADSALHSIPRVPFEGDKYGNTEL